MALLPQAPPPSPFSFIVPMISSSHAPVLQPQGHSTQEIRENSGKNSLINVRWSHCTFLLKMAHVELKVPDDHVVMHACTLQDFEGETHGFCLWEKNFWDYKGQDFYSKARQVPSSLQCTQQCPLDREKQWVFFYSTFLCFFFLNSFKSTCSEKNKMAYLFEVLAPLPFCTEPMLLDIHSF